MSDPLCLFVDVPICAFRPYTSREYQDTYPVPTPSAVYGMLLSLVGVPREEKARHRGVAMALAVERLPQRAKVFRKLRRGRTLGELRPDWQDLLLDTDLWVWLKPGSDCAVPALPSRVLEGLSSPASVRRFGGLSLGESSYLVDTVSATRQPPGEAIFLKPDRSGFYSLPTWVDHSDPQMTRLTRFSLQSLAIEEGLNSCWISIGGE
ncbi:MAG: type I-MYXAN CRISPR-associated protein Cas5/Cmx5/DevS [Planctomycetes bacterium]|nr:type I-MYXAN CRISPR-associated protein Cas5/Cmx5/DevS [Planctomycetota bacterium]